MINRKALAALAFLTFAVASAANAQGKKESLHDMFSGQGYGLAGCGLGSVVFGPKPGMVQVFAATTNGWAGTQTFGISSGTSNCDIPQMGMQAAAFIEVNKEIVKKDAARGEGETVQALAQIMNCSNPAVFGQKVQQNYEAIFAAENDSYESSRQILSTIKANTELAETCAIQG